MKTAIILAEGFEDIEAITTIDVLRRAGISIDVVSAASELVKGARGIIVKSEKNIDEIDSSEYACVVCPGGLPGSDNLMNDERVIGFVQQVYDKGGIAAAICAAPQVLNRAGLLKGKKVTCYPGREKSFDESVIYTKEQFTIDGRIITADGPGSAMIFALELVALLAGREKSETVRLGLRYNL
ncbi:MAG TPA: DJ-1/PfpI family protein [Spirochaetota bacterium]|nr:DJ-1/PfpI family protein [Spirochaetota bacterium]